MFLYHCPNFCSNIFVVKRTLKWKGAKMANLKETVLLFAKRNRITMMGLSRSIGYQSPQTFNAHISNPSKLTIDDAAALAKIMGISLDEVCRLSMANDSH